MSRTVYKALLHLYPQSFRGEYESEMCAVFSRRLRDASGFGLIALWIETFFDALFNAAHVHLDILRQDLRYCGRTLRQSPGYALTVIGIAGLGIGATTAAFSITDHVLLQPLPFPDADRLVTVWEKEPGYAHMELSPSNYRDWKAQSKSFEAFGAYASLSINLAGDGEPERLTGAVATADLLPLIGVKPLLGRWFSEEDDRWGAAGAAILSYSLWQARYGGSAGVVGKKIQLDGEPCTVIGVMPAAFAFPSRQDEIWLPMRFPADAFEDRTNTYLVGVAKLRPGATLERANAELGVVAARLERQYPKELKDTGARAFDLRGAISGQSKTMLMALLGASLCVLLIACMNLANLLLARALARRKELAVRSAMGAGRERLVRQLLTESLLLAMAGGVLGMLIALSATSLFAKLVPTNLPIVALPSADWRVLLFGGLATILTGLAFGVLPALKATGAVDLREGSRSGVGGRKERLRGMLVVAEIAASVVLLVTCGLLIRAMLRIQGTDPGFRADRVLTLHTPVTGPRYAQTVSRFAFYRRVLSEVRALPGVASAAYITALPMVWRGGIWDISLPGKQDAGAQKASMRFVTPDFFATLKIPLHLGRDVAESDVIASPLVAVVSASFAKQYWPGENPLGRRFNCALDDRIVVGVVGDVRVRGLEGDSEPQVYLPYQQVKDGWFPPYVLQDLAIRTVQGDPLQLAPAVRRIIAGAEPQLPVTNVRPLSGIVAGETASRRAQLVVLGGFAGIAFLLAAIGIHGLLSYTVSNRTQEIGVRMALGATRANILQLIVGDAFLLAMIGILLGAAAAYASGLELRSLLAGLSPNDLDAFSAGILLSLVMTIAGSFLPALRAVRVDPATALRAE